MTTLRSLLDRASGFAETLFDPGNVMMPHFVAEAGDGSITVAALALNGRGLDRMRALMAMKFTAEDYRRWVYFSEAWQAHFVAGEPAIEPMNHPERMEVVMFDGFDRHSKKRLRASRQICRLLKERRLLPLVIQRGNVHDAPSARTREQSASELRS